MESAFLNDEDYAPKAAVTDIHKGAKDWFKENKKRIGNHKSLPYFIKDNSNYYKV
jgi:hypothetical protein